MKYTEIPEDFYFQFILQADNIEDKVKSRDTVFISPHVTDANGHFPNEPMNLIGVYLGDVVKLRSASGKEFILRRQQVLSVSSGYIAKLWAAEEKAKAKSQSLELFRQQIEPLLGAKDLPTAAFILELPVCAVWSKLNKARKYGIPVPAWFK